MEVGIVGMLIHNDYKFINNKITPKTIFNIYFFVFVILGFFTFLYLLAIEPELINKKSKKHQNIIENISLKFI
jgi:hypothetical protein